MKYTIAGNCFSASDAQGGFDESSIVTAGDCGGGGLDRANAGVAGFGADAKISNDGGCQEVDSAPNSMG